MYAKRTALVCATVLAALAIPASGAPSEPGSPHFDEHAEYVPPGSSPALERGRATGGPAERAPRALRAGGGSRGLITGFGDFLYISTDADKRDAVMDETNAVNGTVARIYVDWASIAPTSPTPVFDATDPGSLEYDFSRLDAAVEDADAHGLRVILLVNEAPAWAEGPDRPSGVTAGAWKPNPADLGDFGKALARRYAGGFSGLPRVKDYMAWNEPNLPTQLMPQWNGKKPVSPDRYRDMLNAFYDGVHGVSGANTVITGGTAPYGFPNGEYSMRPLLFWRQVMCVKDGRRPKGGKCPSKPRFDVLAHHPINTSGGPRKSAIDPDDVSTPDLHNLVDVLRAAERAHNIGTKGKHPVWATELWWESDPPDHFKKNPSLAGQARYYTEALYLLWKQGASMVLLYQVRDEPHYGEPGRFTGSSYETGVYFVDGKPKPSSRALRFPFLADRLGGDKALLWGKAPESGKVVITQRGPGPKKVADLKVKAGEVFTEKVSLPGKHTLQAKVGGVASPKWKLK